MLCLADVSLQQANSDEDLPFPLVDRLNTFSSSPKMLFPLGDPFLTGVGAGRPCDA